MSSAGSWIDGVITHNRGQSRQQLPGWLRPTRLEVSSIRQVQGIPWLW